MDIETLRSQLVECDRAILELNYLLSEALQRQDLLLSYKTRLVTQAEGERSQFLWIKMPFPHWFKKALTRLDKEMQQNNEELESISCNIASCQGFRTKIERKLTQTFDG